MNIDLINITKYCFDNRIIINHAKTNSMSFFGKRVLDVPPIYMDGVHIPYVTKVKYLGIWIDVRLSFSQESKTLVTRLNRCSGLILRWRNVLDFNSLMNLFNALAIAYINYSHTLMNSINK